MLLKGIPNESFVWPKVDRGAAALESSSNELHCTIAKIRISRTYKEAPDVLLWRDKICLTCTQLYMGWKAVIHHYPY